MGLVSGDRDHLARCIAGGIMGSGYPEGWQEWRRLVADGGYENDNALNRFAARFRMASGMRSVAYPGMGRVTAEGYSVALRVALAYTALEAWEKAMNIAKHTIITSTTRRLLRASAHQGSSGCVSTC